MKQLKIARQKKGLTQEQLAQLVGISRQYYCDIERGRRNPSKQVMESISKTLGVSPIIFFTSDVA